MTPQEVTPEICAELAERLKAKGWTVRKLRTEGFGASAANALLDGVPSVSLSNAERAAALVGMRLSLKRRGRSAQG